MKISHVFLGIFLLFVKLSAKYSFFTQPNETVVNIAIVGESRFVNSRGMNKVPFVHLEISKPLVIKPLTLWIYIFFFF